MPQIRQRQIYQSGTSGGGSVGNGAPRRLAFRNCWSESPIKNAGTRQLRRQSRKPAPSTSSPKGKRNASSPRPKNTATRVGMVFFAMAAFTSGGSSPPDFRSWANRQNEAIIIAIGAAIPRTVTSPPARTVRPVKPSQAEPKKNKPTIRPEAISNRFGAYCFGGS